MPHLLYILLYVLYTAAFLWVIYRVRFFDIPRVKKAHLAFFFLLKVVAGLALTLIYTYYYTDQSKADIYRYFTDSKIISSLLFTHPLHWLKVVSGAGAYDSDTFSYLKDTLYFSHPSNDLITNNRLLIRITSLLNYFSFYNIYIDTLLLNCITFTGITGLFKFFRPYFSSLQQVLYWPLYLLPTVVFWGSGLLKEGLLFSALAAYLYFVIEFNRQPALKTLLYIFLGIAFIALIKIYVAVVVVICSVFLLLPMAAKENKLRLVFAVACYAAVILLLCFYFAGDLSNEVINKRNEFIQLGLTEHSNSILGVTQISNRCNSIVGLLPSAFVNAVLRPFLWDTGSLFQLLFAIENCIFILVVVLLPLFYFKRPEGHKLMLALFCFFFALFNYLIIGLTIPILGAIVHYRVIAMPFLLLTVLLTTDLEKLKPDVIRLFSGIHLKS